MRDLLIIVPTRGRPQNAARLLEAVRDLAELETDVFFGLDEDDPARVWYEGTLLDRKPGPEVSARVAIRPRMGLAEWTNFAAGRHGDRYRFLASFGDDHLPRTKGFDRKLTRVIGDMGGTGFAYPYDGMREDIPEAVVMSSDIPLALGYMCPPGLKHYYIDNVWGDLGRWAGCLRYCRAVAVDHLHPGNGMARVDDLYAGNSQKVDEDREAYNEWRATRMIADARKICALKDKQ